MPFKYNPFTGTLDLVADTSSSVDGPASSTDNAIARFDGTTGKLIQDSGVIIDDSDVVTGITQLDVDNIRLDLNTISSTDTNGDVVISPDGTGGGVVTTNLTIGNTVQDVDFTINGAAVSGLISVEGTNSTDLGGIISHRHSNTAGFGGHVLDLRSRGTHSSPSIVNDGDTISLFAGAGFDGTDYALSSQIKTEVDGTPGSDDMPGRIILSTSADGTQAPVEGLRLDSSQVVTLANALPVGSGGIGVISNTAYAVLCGGTTSTGPVQSVASVGTSGHVLTSNGAAALPTFQAAAGGGSYEYISTATASSSATISFTGLSATYSTYVVIIDNLAPANDDSEFWMRTSTDNGSSYDSGASDYSWSFAGRETGTLTDTTEIVFYRILGNNTNETSSFIVNIFNPSDTSYTEVTASACATDTTGTRDAMICAGVRLSAADVDAIQFLMNTGNIATGTFNLYGIKAS